MKWSEKVTNEEIVECVREKRKLLNNILHRKGNWTGHSLRRNFLLHESTEGLMTEAKRVRRTQLLVNLRNILGAKGGN